MNLDETGLIDRLIVSCIPRSHLIATDLESTPNPISHPPVIDMGQVSSVLSFSISYPPLSVLSSIHELAKITTRFPRSFSWVSSSRQRSHLHAWVSSPFHEKRLAVNDPPDLREKNNALCLIKSETKYHKTLVSKSTFLRVEGCLLLWSTQPAIQQLIFITAANGNPDFEKWTCQQDQDHDESVHDRSFLLNPSKVVVVAPIPGIFLTSFPLTCKL